MSLLENLIKDERKINKDLYSAGPYWRKRAKRAIFAIKKYGVSDFRSVDSNIGVGFVDNENIDARNSYFINLEKFLTYLINIYPFRKIFELQLSKTKGYYKKLLHYKRKYYQNNPRVRFLIDKFELRDTCNFGCSNYFNLNNNEFAFHYIEILNNHDYLTETINFTKIKNMFEIGGGYGQYIHILLQNYSNIKKILYLDIVPNIYVGTEYLKSFYGKSVIDYNITRDMNKIEFTDNNNLEIICIAPWQIEKVQCSIDYFHNSHSFIEMPKNVILNYFKYIDKFLSKEGRISIVTYHNPEYSIQPAIKEAPFLVDIKSILDKFFPKKLKSYQKNDLLYENRKNYFFIG